MTNSIVIRNVDTNVTFAEMVLVAAALQRQALEHVYPAWNVDATVRVETPDEPRRDDEIWLELRKVPTLDDALGYHDVTPMGRPIIYVFPELDVQDGVPWSTTASHEIAETLCDPWCRGCTQADDGTIFATEVADAVEQDYYDIDGVLVSNFCYPAWFSPPSDASDARYDQMGLCARAWEIRDGGYAQTWTGSQWSQLGQKRPGRVRRGELGLSRRTP